MKIHVVKTGETFMSLEKEYGISGFKIAEDNGLYGDTALVTGQALIIADGEELTNQKNIRFAGYAYPNITDEVLDTAKDYLYKICMFSYHINPDGTMVDILPFSTEKNINEAHIHKCMVLTNIGSDGDYCADLCRNLIDSEDAVSNLISNVLREMKKNNYLSLDMDFQYIYPRDKNKYSNFVGKLTDAIHENGYTISCTLPPKMSDEIGGAFFGGYDYDFIGKTVDNVCMMTYNWGNTFSPPGPVSPINDVEKSLQYALAHIPKEKLYLGIQNYGFDWTRNYTEYSSARKMENSYALSVARYYNSEILYDEEHQSPYFTYSSSYGYDRIVWFEDARSLRAKLELAIKYDLYGISIWTINNPAKTNWMLADSMFNIIK